MAALSLFSSMQVVSTSLSQCGHQAASSFTLQYIKANRLLILKSGGVKYKSS